MRWIRQDFEEISAALEKQVYEDMQHDDRRRLVELFSVIEKNLKK